MKKGTSHDDKMTSLRRIEGQVRGIQKMVEERRYCVDILNAMAAVHGALRTVEAGILRDHLNSCVRTALGSSSESEKKDKLNEIAGLFQNLRK